MLTLSSYIQTYSNLISLHLACVGFTCPSGSTCRVCEETGEAYCEYSCDMDNGGCSADTTCTETPITCPPGQCCSSVNITCEGKKHKNAYVCMCIHQHVEKGSYYIALQSYNYIYIYIYIYIAIIM